MRRKVFVLVALLALMACGVAYASSGGPDVVAGSVTAKANGSAKKPAVTSVTEKFTIKNATSGDYAYPATNIKATIGNLKVENVKSYPTCTAAQVNADTNGEWNGVCSSSSEIATGSVSATLYPIDTPTAGGVACNLGVAVYNAGQGKLTFFLTATGTQCDGGALQTGAAAAWTATYKESGSSLILNVPLPADVSTNAGNLNAFWAAINSETLNFKKISVKNKPVIVSTGCKKNKRAYTLAFNITNGSKTTTQSTSGKSAC